MTAPVDAVVRVEVTERIGRVTLDRPERMNAITVALGAELEAALLDLGARDDVNVVVLRGAGGNFSAGGDFEEVRRLRAAGPEALGPLFESFSRACAAIARIDQPVVAVVEGVAMAGGFELMLAADLVLIRDDARIGDNHVNYGQVPGGGSTQRLPRLLGPQRALGLLLSGDRLTGAGAAALGLAHRSFPVETWDADVESFLATLAGRHPGALRRIKRLVHDGLALSLEGGIALELRAVVDHIAGEAGAAGVSAFAERTSS